MAEPPPKSPPVLPPGVPVPPREPTREECCGRGCDPCIFDYYDRALERWEARVRALGHDPDALRRG